LNQKLERDLHQLRSAHEQTLAELAKTRASFDVYAKDLQSQYAALNEQYVKEKNDLEYEIAGLNESTKEWSQRCASDEQKLGYYESLLREQQTQLDKLSSDLEQKENTVLMLKNSLLLRVNQNKASATANSSNDTDSDDLEVINKVIRNEKAA
jgi:hypothetical protein